MTQIVAAKIIELAQRGVRDHDALLKMTLQEFRSPKYKSGRAEGPAGARRFNLQNGANMGARPEIP